MLKLGSWLFDDTSRRLLRGSRERKVSPKAADVLRALAETPGQVWSRDALLERGWPGVVVGEEVLTHAIAELRKALDDDPRTPRYIETIHKAGYRLLASVAQLSTPAATCAEGLTLLDDAADFEIDAYSFYLSGIWLWEHDDARAAADMFASALRLSPNFALAHAGMAKALADAATYQEPHADERRRLLERALDHSRAAKFGGITAQAVAAEAFVFAMTGHARRAKAGYAAAIRMAPNDAETHRLLGRLCFTQGEATLAAQMFERAAILAPEDVRSFVLAATASRKAGKAEGVELNLARALKRMDVVHARITQRHVCCHAQCLLQLGATDRAGETLQLGAGHTTPCYHLAGAYALAGERRRSLQELEGAIAKGWRHRDWFDNDPCFDGLRDDRHFRRIAGTMRAPL